MGSMSLYRSPDLITSWFQTRFFIMSLWEQMTPFEWPLWIPGAWLADKLDKEEHLALQHINYIS